MRKQQTKKAAAPAVAAATCEGNGLLERFDALEGRVRVLERCPSVRHQVSMIALDDMRREQDRTDEKAQADRRAAGEPARKKRFAEYTADRLTFFDDLSTQPGPIWADYLRWCEDGNLAPIERFDSAELAAAIEKLPNVEPARVFTSSGGKTGGWRGVCLTSDLTDEDRYRMDHPAPSAAVA